jgi:hypothetical protein
VRKMSIGASEKGLRKQYKWLPLRHFEVFESHSMA